MNTIVEGLIDSGHKIKVLAVNSFKYSVDINSIPDDYKEKTQIEGIFLDLRIKPLDAFLNLFSSKSYHVQRFISKEFEEKIIEILSKNKYDIIQLETLYVTPYIEAIRKHSDAKIVLRAHNIEHLIWDRITQATKNPIKKFYLSHLSKTLKKYELEALDKFDGIAAITKTDADFFKKTGTKTPIVDIPFGINLNKFQLSDGEYEFPSLFHIGSMNWMPNEEGIDWFLNKVWDLIYKKMPDLKIYLAGREMPDWLINYKKTNVEVVGEVENAQDFIKKIKKKGYTPFIVGGEESDWYKTRIGPYPSKEEADQVVLDLKMAQGITAIVLVSDEDPPDLEEPIDSVDVVVSQFLIWLKAWEAQKINSYLSFYSKDFKDSKRPRKSWEAQRRKVFGSSSGVSIEVSDIQILRANDAVEMSFIQSYKSDRISDVGKKVLIWKNEGDRWKIVKESWEAS